MLRRVRLTERHLIGVLPTESVTLRELAARACGRPTRSEIEAVRRIVKRFAGEELVALGYRVEGGRRHLTAAWFEDEASGERVQSGDERQLCGECGRSFMLKQSTTVVRRDGKVIYARYCSPACRQAAYRARKRYGAAHTYAFTYRSRKRRKYVRRAGG
jgi:hypothetical protein